MNRVARNAERIKECAVFLRVAPQVDGVGVKPVFAGEQGTGDTGARSKVADAGAAGDACIAKELLAELEGFGPIILERTSAASKLVAFGKD